MKKIISLLASILITLSIYAQNKTGDTLKLKWKDSKIWIFSDETKPIDSVRIKKIETKNKNKFAHWSGIDIGICALTTAYSQFSIPKEEDSYGINYFLDLKYNRSWYFSFNFIEKNFCLYKNYVNLVTGLGIDWSSYNFKNNIILDPNAENINSSTITIDTASNKSYIKNQIKVTYVKIPLLLEFNTSLNANKSFHLSGGMEFGYKIDSWTKRKFNRDDYMVNEKMHDDYNLSMFKYGIVVRAGYNNLSLFFNYSLSPLFDEEKGPQKILYPLAKTHSLHSPNKRQFWIFKKSTYSLLSWRFK